MQNDLKSQIFPHKFFLITHLDNQNDTSHAISTTTSSLTLNVTMYSTKKIVFNFIDCKYFVYNKCVVNQKLQ